MSDFRNPLAEFVFYRTYARWLEIEQRRETWEETVNRYFENVIEPLKENIPNKILKEIKDSILHMDVMPSMRAMWSAGKALKENNITAYNCCYLPIKDVNSFSELLYILMHGTGVGFSVEENYIGQLPIIQANNSFGNGIHKIQDSKEGWAESLRIGLKTWYEGKDIEFDYDDLRPRGARLKTMGGRSSGPDPLKNLHSFVRDTLKNAQGRKLKSIEVLDICCKIAEIVVVGGVRRSSLISFSDLNDVEMMKAKHSPMPTHRFMSNNSVVIKDNIDSVTFLREWYNLAQSNTGERGLYNIKNLNNFAPRRLFTGEERSNPCGEIILRPYQFCNLSEVVIRSSDSFDDVVSKIRGAVWIGAIQSTLTNFKYIRNEFKINCEEERLLGVSLTGQLDNPRVLSEEKLQILKEYAIKTAKQASKALEINLSTSITTGKPSGTVSQLVDAASGCHPRFSRYYIRRVRISATDPLYKMMKDQGVIFEPEVGHNPDNPDTWVVSFPIKSPKNAITRYEMDAIKQLEWYSKIQNNWCEHNQSTTVFVKPEEWAKVGSYVYDNLDKIIGVSFLPFDGGEYKLAPYEEITEEQYNKLMKVFPKIDYTQLKQYELEDNTVGAQTLACTSGVCELE